MLKFPKHGIKNEIDDFVINNMVFASNFYEESYPVFEKIKFFADIYRSHIYLLKIITPKEFEPTSVSQKLANSFIKLNINRNQKLIVAIFYQSKG